MKPPNLPTAEDIAAFHAAIAGTIPLRQADWVRQEVPKPPPQPRQRQSDEAAVIAELLHRPLSVDDWLDVGGADAFLRAGLPRAVLRDLRRGRWSIQDHIDLHGMNRHQAHDVVFRFLAESRVAGKRCLRIVHGRGNGSPGQEPVLRQLVKSWLGRCRDVLAFCHPPLVDGGEGALWVLLRGDGKRR